jgi:hypothetical protein
MRRRHLRALLMNEALRFVQQTGALSSALVAVFVPE